MLGDAILSIKSWIILSPGVTHGWLAIMREPIHRRPDHPYVRVHKLNSDSESEHWTQLLRLLCSKHLYVHWIQDISNIDIVPLQRHTTSKHTDAATSPFLQATLGIPEERRCTQYRLSVRWSIRKAGPGVYIIYIRLASIRQNYSHTPYIYAIYVYSLYIVYIPRLVLGARRQVGFHVFTCHSIDLDETNALVLFNL